jgi:hypothetical protein
MISSKKSEGNQPRNRGKQIKTENLQKIAQKPTREIRRRKNLLKELAQDLVDKFMHCWITRHSQESQISDGKMLKQRATHPSFPLSKSTPKRKSAPTTTQRVF